MAVVPVGLQSHLHPARRIRVAAVVVSTVVVTPEIVLQVTAVKLTMAYVPQSALKGRPALGQINVTAVIVWTVCVATSSVVVRAWPAMVPRRGPAPEHVHRFSMVSLPVNARLSLHLHVD